jgi:hypothetical protein
MCGASSRKENRMYTPPTSAVVAVTIEGDLFADLEKWRRRQVNVLPRTFAVKELLARALATERRRARSAECVRGREDALQ